MTCVISPNSGRELGAIAESSNQDIEAALEQSSLCVRKPMSAEARRQLLFSWADCMLGARRELASIIVQEVGKLPSEATSEVDYAAEFLRAAGDAIEVSDKNERFGERLIAPQPLGVALLLAPYNDPLAGLTRKIGPAIAAGCAAIVKPSPLGGLSAQALSRLICDPARLHWLHLSESNSITKLIEDDRVDVVSFTGSTIVGQRIALAAASGPKKCVMELGGNCPFIVLNDADLDIAVRDLIGRKIRSAGQACSAVNRVYVEQAIARDFCERLAAAVSTLQTGPSDQSGMHYDPVRTKEAQLRLAALKRRCIESGMTIFAEAKNASERSGAFVVPLTIMGGASLDQAPLNPLDSEEAFGPIMSVQSFDVEEKLLSRLRTERHALAAYCYGSDSARLQRITDALWFGSVGVNSIAIQGADVPTGGCRAAGYGREGGVWGVREFMTTKNIRLMLN